MRLTVLVKGGKEELCFKSSLVIERPSEILLKSATVYWNYNNIDNDLENFITVDGKRLDFKHGYWSFDDIKLELEKKGVSITRERVTGKCVVSVDDQTHFEKFGDLLGLDPSTNLAAGTTTITTNTVNINRGLRSLDIKCNIVDKSKNIDQNGQYSDVMASVPIPTDKTLKGSLSHYSDINSKVSINRGAYNFLEFKVSSNIERYVGDVLLELYITPK